MKLDKLNVMLMVGKDGKDLNANRASIDSAPTTSRDLLDSTTRAYAKAALGLRDEGLTHTHLFIKIK